MQHNAEAAPPPSQPEQSANIEIPQSRIKKFGHALLAGALVAATLAGIRGNDTEKPSINQSIQVDEAPAVANPVDSSSTIEVGAPHQEAQIHNVNTYNNGDAIHFSSNGDGINNYEIDFHVEQNDAVQSREQIDTFVLNNAETIKTAIEDGQIISVTGLSSAEDDTPGGGLMEQDKPNAKGRDNKTLALERGNLASTALADSISEQLGIEFDSDQLTVTGIEDQWSQEQVDEATQLSEQFGYSSLKSMIDQWNRGPKQKNEFHPTIQEFLTSSLDQKRGFEISIPTPDEVVETPVSGTVSTPPGSENQPAGIAIDGHADLPAPVDTGIRINPKTGEVEFADVSGFPPPNIKVVETNSSPTEEKGKKGKKKKEEVKPPITTVYPPPIRDKNNPDTGKITESQFRQRQIRNIQRNPNEYKLPNPNNYNNRNPSQRGERGASSTSRNRNGGRK